MSRPIPVATSAGKLHSARLSTVTACDFDTLKPHLAAWDHLAQEAPQRNPYLLPGWVDAAFRHALGRNERWFCSFAYIGDRLIGVMPTFVVPHPLLGRSYPILRTFDKHATSGEILLAPEHAGTALQALLCEARRQEPRHLGLDLKAVRPSSPFWSASRTGIDDYVTLCGLTSAYSFLNVEEDFDAYFSTSNLRNMRSKLRRHRRRLMSRGVVSVEMRKGPSADETLLTEFLALEGSGWKGRNGTAITSRTDRAAFYSAVTRNMAAQGYLEWHTIRLDGRLIAAEMGIRCGTSLFLPKIAYDEDFADCSPGSLLTEEVLKDAFSRPEIDEYNPMSDADWHRLWHLRRETYVNVHLVRRAATPILFQLPRVALRSGYETHVRPRIPAYARQVWRQLRRPLRRPQKAKGD